MRLMIGWGVWREGGVCHGSLGGGGGGGLCVSVCDAWG